MIPQTNQNILSNTKCTWDNYTLDDWFDITCVKYD